LANVLDLFRYALGLQNNHSKFVAFWLRGKKEAKPDWTKDFNWTWASLEAISKLLGNPLDSLLALLMSITFY
jgi:hypothetical protein